MIEIRETKDIDALMKMRMEVLDCVFNHPAPGLMHRLEAANRSYYERHLADDSHIACLAYDTATAASCGSGALCLSDEMPSPDNPSGRCAYIMNVYVRPECRGRGIASSVVEWLVERARALGAGKIYLEATDAAAPLYHRLGFRDMANMMKYEDREN